jgi:hypothetical protein
MIPLDQGGGGYTLGKPGIPKTVLDRNPLSRPSAKFFFVENSPLTLDVPA